MKTASFDAVFLYLLAEKLADGTQCAAHLLQLDAGLDAVHQLIDQIIGQIHTNQLLGYISVSKSQMCTLNINIFTNHNIILLFHLLKHMR